MVKSLAKVKSIFICENCGYESPKWLGKCPDCNNWNTFEESLVEKKSSVAAVAKKVSLTVKHSTVRQRFPSKFVFSEIALILIRGFFNAIDSGRYQV